MQVSVRRPRRIRPCGPVCSCTAVLILALLILLYLPSEYSDGHPTIESTFIRPRPIEGVLDFLYGRRYPLKPAAFVAGNELASAIARAQQLDESLPLPRPSGDAGPRRIGLEVEKPGEYALCAAAFFLHSNCSTIVRTAVSFADILGPEHPVYLFLDKDLMGGLGSSPEMVAAVAAKKVVVKELFHRRVQFHNDKWHELNQVFTTKQFWYDLPCRRVLIFQEDATLCSTSKFKVEDFMMYDWIGAQWPWEDPHHPAYLLKLHIGNGGFSIRSKAFMLLILELYPFEIYGRGQGESVLTPRGAAIKNEDMWYADRLRAIAQDPSLPLPRLPTLAESSHFAYETGPVPAAAPFGMHFYKRLPPENWCRVLDMCPEALPNLWNHCWEADKPHGGPHWIREIRRPALACRGHDTS